MITLIISNLGQRTFALPRAEGVSQREPDQEGGMGTLAHFERFHFQIGLGICEGAALDFVRRNSS